MRSPLLVLVGALDPDRGQVKWGHQAQVGYLPQDHAGIVRNGTTLCGNFEPAPNF